MSSSDVPFYLSQSSAGVDSPSSLAQLTGGSLITTNDSFVRVAYRAAAQSASEEALQVIDGLGRGDIPGVASASEAAFNARNNIRIDAQSQLSPGGAANSRAIEPERTFASQFERYAVTAENGAVDEFATYRAIASAAGRTNSVVNGFSVAGKFGGPVLAAAGVGTSIYNVAEAAPNMRAEIASEEIGANLGGLVGYAGGSLVTGYAALGVGAALGLASIPALPLLAATVIVGGTAAYFGSQFGRDAFKNAYRSLSGE